MAPTVEVKLRVQITSDGLAGWHSRDRKDFQAAIDDVAFRVCDQEISQGTAWRAMLTQSGDAEAASGLVRLLHKLRHFTWA